ncbi:RNA-binding protein [Myxococcota bacterium]|nr:RNA-binding protein [Myxococcota bacterium]
MKKKLYVGNLPFSTTENELRELFEQYGATESVAVITDRETGRSRGFGFVEFDETTSAEAAVSALDGKDFGNRSLRVSEALDRRQGDGRR